MEKIYWDGLVDWYSYNNYVTDQSASWTFTNNGTNIQMYGTRNTEILGSGGVTVFTKPIPDKPFTKLTIEYECVLAGAYGGALRVVSGTTISDRTEICAIGTGAISVVGDHTLELTLSGAYQGKYVAFSTFLGQNATIDNRIKRIYLE